MSVELIPFTGLESLRLAQDLMSAAHVGRVALEARGLRSPIEDYCGDMQTARAAVERDQQLENTKTKLAMGKFAIMNVKAERIVGGASVAYDESLKFSRVPLFPPKVAENLRVESEFQKASMRLEAWVRPDTPKPVQSLSDAYKALRAICDEDARVLARSTDSQAPRRAYVLESAFSPYEVDRAIRSAGFSETLRARRYYSNVDRKGRVPPIRVVYLQPLPQGGVQSLEDLR